MTQSGARFGGVFEAVEAPRLRGVLEPPKEPEPRRKIVDSL